MGSSGTYVSIIEQIFLSRFKKGMAEVSFEREDIVRAAKKLKVPTPKNLGDLIYSFRYRATLPKSITSKASKGNAWIIRPAGHGKYRFVLVPDRPLVPNPDLVLTKIPDSTPGMISKYALSDEQALLARVRYNRLLDIFTGVACYSLQNHLRTTVPGIGQVETDEIYVGVDKGGIHYAFPVQAKGGSDRFSVVHIEQNLALCKHKFPSLVCRPIGTQFMTADIIVLFEFEEDDDSVRIAAERHYKLVPSSEVSAGDLKRYKQRLGN